MLRNLSIRPQGRVQRALFALFFLMAGLLPASAFAAPSAYCGPYTIPVNYNSGVTFNITGCDGGSGLGISVILAPPAQHGTVQILPASGGTQWAQYTHDGSAGTTDVFYLQDLDGDTITVNVNVVAPTIVVNPASVSGASVGAGFSQVFSASGSAGPFTYAISAGALPMGLSLNASSGALTGTPTQAGTFNFTVQATNPGGYSGTRAYTLVVAPPTLIVGPLTLPNGTAGTAYSQTATASGGIAPYTFGITSGALPPGLSMSSAGAISGTPTAGGSYIFTVTVTSASTGTGAPHTGSRAYTVVINPPTITLPATTLSNGNLGQAYSAPLNAATGGTSPYTYAVTAGALPPGLTLAAGTGAISGTPSSAGNYNFAVTATDSSGGTGPYTSAPRGYSLQVVSGPPVANPVSATVTYNSGANPITLNITGGVPSSVAVSSGPTHGNAIASGMNITYQPDAGYSGPDSFTYTATNGGGTSTPATVVVTVGDPTITIGASAPFSAQIGVAYTQTFTWNGGTQPFSAYQVLNLPAGLSVIGTSANSVTVSGTPTQSGSFNLNVSARDSSTGNGPYTVGQLFSLTVSAPTLTLTPSAGTLSATYGVPYSLTYVAGGGTGPFNYAISAGALPAGLSINASTGVLSGTPTTTGLYTFSVRARDNSTGTGAPFARTQNYVMQVAAPVIALSGFSSIGGPAGTPLAGYVYTATGGIAPYTFSVSAGTLPPGVTLSSSGLISGTPTLPGTYNTMVRATDANGQSGDMFVSFPIATPLITLTNSAPLNGTAGVAQSVTFSATGSTGSYTYSLTSGAMPVGMSFSSAGVYSGTPRSDGTFNLTVQATDGSGNSGSRVFTLTVAPATVVITPATLPSATRGATYSQALSSTGGIAPYTYSLAAGSLPVGIALSSAGVFSGVPQVAGTYNLVVRSTDDAGYNATMNYALQVNAPTIALTASAPLDGTAGVAQSATISASGGAAPYIYSLVAGTLPVGMSFSSAGALSGTPTTAGVFNLTVQATDANGNTGSAGYSITIAAPVIAVAPTTLPDATRGTAYTQALAASGGTAPYTYSLPSGALPAGVSLTSAGVLSGTPAADGSFSFTVMATDALGFTASQAYTLAVNQNAPQLVDDEASVLSGAAATIAVTGNDTGTITSIAISSAPAHGTATVNGLSIVYTPAAGYAGADSLAYTATGPGGTSTPATVRLTINPLPVPVSRTVQAQAGIAVEVDVTEGATGGPFTAATLVSLSPAQAGTASIVQRGAAYILSFTPASAFSGVATARFTLANAFATSAEAAITFQVIARPDPTQDAEVQGLLNAQAQATRRFASAQINNFQRRLESLHNAGAGAGFSNGLTFQSSTHCRSGAQDLPTQLCDPRTSEQDAANPRTQDRNVQPQRDTPFGLWLGGAIRSGQQDQRANRARADFETDGLSVGGDYRLNERLAIGAGLGWGRDDSQIGTQGSRSQGDAYTLAGYASFHPGRTFVDALVGYQRLSYDLRRYVTASGGHVSGSRDGSQWFGSISAGADLAFEAANFTPYARLDFARASLDAYTEHGDALYALHHADMDVDTSTGNVGLRLDFQRAQSWGTLTPQFRLEYQYDFQGHGSAAMSYADLLSGPFYRTGLPVYDRSRLMLGLGLGFQGEGGFSTRIEYNGMLQGVQGSDHGFMLNLEKRY